MKFKDIKEAVRFYNANFEEFCKDLLKYERSAWSCLPSLLKNRTQKCHSILKTYVDKSQIWEDLIQKQIIEFLEKGLHKSTFAKTFTCQQEMGNLARKIIDNAIKFNRNESKRQSLWGFANQFFKPNFQPIINSDLETLRKSLRSQLSESEKDFFDLMVTEHSIDEIMLKLNLTLESARTIRSRIRNKLKN